MTSRILIDLQGAQAPNSAMRGIGRYTLSFVRHLVDLKKSQFDFHFLLNGRFEDTALKLSQEFGRAFGFDHIHIFWTVENSRAVDPSGFYRKSVSRVLRSQVIQRARPDVLLITSMFEGLVDDAIMEQDFQTGRPLIVGLIYDVIPFLFPKLYLQSAVTRRWYYEVIRQMKAVDLALAISEATRSDLIREVGCSPDAVVTVDGAPDVRFSVDSLSTSGDRATRTRYGIGEHYILYTGGNEQRKNIPFLIKAFIAASLRVADVSLVIVCKIDPESIVRLTVAAGLSSLPASVIFTDYVPDDDLASLYRGCDLFVFPSWYEGLGLPILEAAIYGAPIVAAGTSSMAEIMAMPSATFDPYDVLECADVLVRGLTEKSFISALRENSRKIRERYTWDRTINATVAGMEAALRRHNALNWQARSKRHGRPTLANVSPLQPERTGIALYAHEAVPGMEARFDLTSVSDQSNIADVEIMLCSSIMSRREFRTRVYEFDYVLYHIGNSHFHLRDLEMLQQTPGMVVMHDPYLGGVLTHTYRESNPVSLLRAYDSSHGIAAAVAQLGQTTNFSDNGVPLLLSSWAVTTATAVLVHSQFAKSLLRDQFGERLASKTHIINFPLQPKTPLDRLAARRILGFGADEIVLCSFGFIAPIKGSEEIVDAWARVARDTAHPLRLVLAGDCGDEGFAYQLKQRAVRAGLGDMFRITGFAEQDVYEQYLSTVDIAVQLRRSGRGESSMTIAECLSYGIPTIINENGSLAEFSRDATCMLPDEFSIGELTDAIQRLVGNADARLKLAANAKVYAEAQFDVSKFAETVERVGSQAEGSNAYWRFRTMREISYHKHPPLNQFDRHVIPEAVRLTFPPETTKPRLYFDVSSWNETAASEYGEPRFADLVRASMTNGTACLIFDLLDTRQDRFAIDMTIVASIFSVENTVPTNLPRNLGCDDKIVCTLNSRVADTNLRALVNFALTGGSIFVPIFSEDLIKLSQNTDLASESLNLHARLGSTFVVRKGLRQALLNHLDQHGNSEELRVGFVLLDDEDFTLTLTRRLFGSRQELSITETWRSRKRWYFPASDTRVQVGAGRRLGPIILATGRQGHMIYGPYIELPPASYRFVLDAHVVCSAGARLEVVGIDAGEEITLCDRSLNEAPETEGSFECSFKVEHHLERCEVRLYVSAASRIGVNGFSFMQH